MLKVFFHSFPFKKGFLCITNPVDLFYVLKKPISSGVLLYDLQQEQEILFTDLRYAGAFKDLGFCVVETKTPFQTALERVDGKDLYLKENVLGAQELLLLKKKKKAFFSDAGWIDSLRAVKTKEEIALMERAALITKKALIQAKRMLFPGITERSLAEKIALHMGFLHAHPGFETIVAFGKNSAFPHHRPTETPWNGTDIVQIDTGACFKNYNADFSVVLFAEKDPFFQNIFLFLETLLRASLKKMYPGALLEEVDLFIREEMQKKDLENFFLHSLGHGIGLEVHEPPFFKGESRKTVLKEGMIFAIEPGLYFEGRGGVRLEKMVLVKKEGAQFL